MSQSSRERFEAALAAAGIDSSIVDLPASARTAEEAATTLACTVAEIAKSLVFRVGESPLLVVMSGVNRASPERIEAVIGAPIGKADARFVRDVTGYAIGGVPPFGHVDPIPTLLDEDLFRFEAVWAAAGGPSSVFRVAPPVLARVTSGRRLPLKS